MNPFNPVKNELAFQKQEEAAAILSILPDSLNAEPEKDAANMSLLAAIVESSDDAIISKSLDGIILSWNKGSERMFGYTAKQVLGKPITMLIPPDFFNEEKSILERICNNEVIDHFETVRIRQNGEPLNVSLTVSPLKDKKGTIIGVSKIARDITSRKKSETDFLNINKELAFQNDEKEKRAAELITANIELRFQNQEKEKRAAELIIANKELIFQNEEKEKRAAELLVANKELAFQNGEKEKRAEELIIANKELAFQNEEKENRAAELAIANKELIFQNNEKEKRAAELIIAINDLKIAEGQIIEVNKELESFSYSVSHDLRAPLRAINGYTNKLKTNFETQLDPEANRLMNNIVQNAKKMGMLIDDLLTFSRVGRREMVKINIRMHSLVQEICCELKAEVPDRNIEFRIGNLPPALADNMAIKQVWLNLVSNAIKYTSLKDTAIIEIGSEENGEAVTYFIKDNGAGFDMRYANKLFGVFQRLHSDEEFDGTGVGLALVHRLISKHGGHTWAEAKVNEGATFYFSLNKP
ncbi:MAG: Phytochrome-like protein cph1 [Ferruginibacter sp.]|uniref:PAS domain-containing sensor histidine kinase n=1 Tax=Ferruginibacter sp. TaxID=1940288 RepID=UPI00265983E0|nr:PAS domain S-box protein [Ferruginibacter sp.]MDB5280800.1 Phytochrome-like protein cph1 [Ferruginibacter sp.]